MSQHQSVFVKELICAQGLLHGQKAAGTGDMSQHQSVSVEKFVCAQRFLHNQRAVATKGATKGNRRRTT